MLWRLIPEEFGPELKYIKGEQNVVAKDLYHLEMSDNKEIPNISDTYGYNNEDMTDSAYPIRYCGIVKTQKTDAKLNQKLVSHKYYIIDTFHGGDQTIV